MSAILSAGPGGAETLSLGTLPTPRLADGRILVKVAAAGVNRPDILQRQGLYPAPKGAPETLGLEIAGTVVAAGPGASAVKVGDQVCALVAGGGYAEYCLVDEPLALPIPAGMSLIEAAALPETCFTVWTNVFDDAGLQSGETFLVHGATSGIGVTAIQLAKAFGARVVATCGSDEKCAAARDLGADLAVNYNRDDFVEVVKGAGGADVVLDMVGGDYVDRNLKCLNRGGRLVQIAFLKGSRLEVDLLPLMLKRLRLSGSTLRARPVVEKAAIARSLLENVWPLAASGAFKAVIDSTFPLAAAGKAHARMESGSHIGKIVLDVAQ